MDGSLLDKIKEKSAAALAAFKRDKADDLDDVSAAPKFEEKPKPNMVSDDAYSSLSRVLVGDLAAIEGYYFPPELIGGSCPRVHGSEESTVWNAAADAADSERVHVVWHAAGERVWYIAVRAADMASHPHTWCPFAALLPGMKDAVPPPACYTCYSDETAVMMTISADGLQIHRGTSSVLRAKAERTARELGGAPVIDLVPDVIAGLSPTPWFSMSLFEDRSRRILSAVSVFASMAVAAVAVFIWFVAAMAAMNARGDIEATRAEGAEKSGQLLKMVQDLRASPMREQLAKFADLNDGLLALNGLLEVYQIKDGKILWRAVLPPSVTSERINELGGQTLDSNANGVVVGNSKEALTMTNAPQRR